MTLTGTLIFGEDSEITPRRRVPLTAISSGRLWRGERQNLPLQRFGQVSEGGGGCKCDIARDKALKSQITKLLTSIQIKQ